MESSSPNRSYSRRWKVVTVMLSAAVLAAVLILVRSDKTPSTGSDSPDDCIRELLAAAQAGDSSRFLNCFAGELRAKYTARFARLSPEETAAELKRRTSGLKSTAVSDRRSEGSDGLSLVFEKIYAGHNDRYRMMFNRSSGQWKIVEMTPLARIVPEIPYGTPVVPEAGQRDREQ